MNTGFVLDDLPEMRTWLVQCLQQSFPGIHASATSNIEEARSWLRDHSAPELALIDLGLPDGDGIEIIDMLNRSAPDCVTIVASIYDDDRHIFPALRAGAKGYILKDQDSADIVPLLQGIAAGRPPLSPTIARKILASFRPAVVKTRTSVDSLTGRETEVLTFISKGMTMSETAKLLGISRHTVDGYVKEIYRKLNVSSRAEAALSAKQMGLV